MKNKYYWSVLMLLMLSLSLLGCSKDDEEVNPGPEITVTGVEDGGTYSTAAGVDFTASISDPDGIAYVQVIISQNGFELYNEKEEEAFQDKKTEYTTAYTTGPLPSAYAGTYQVRVEASDSKGKLSTKEYTITLN